MISNIKAINPFKNDNQFESDEEESKDYGRIYKTKINQRYCCSVSNDIENSINLDNKETIEKVIEIKLINGSQISENEEAKEIVAMNQTKRLKNIRIQLKSENDKKSVFSEVIPRLTSLDH